MPNFDVFGVGFLEILVVLVLALIVIGPQRLPEVAVQLGRAVGQMRRYANQFRREFMEEFGDIQAEWEMSQKEYREVQRQLSDVSVDVRSIDRDVKDATREVNAALRPPIESSSRPKSDETLPSNVVPLDDAATQWRDGEAAGPPPEGEPSAVEDASPIPSPGDEKDAIAAVREAMGSAPRPKLQRH
ncbi:MAG TPA: Sec-independent protein translocase protein TatB [Dehalococcoidia bacterium]|nr:Sec-independent protein translocase protein TatB [Dehalococcoidia bacterium]